MSHSSTGLSPHTVTGLGAFGQVPAVETGRVHMFLVDCEHDPNATSSLEPGEDLTTELVPIARLDRLVASAEMDCIACVAATYKLLLLTQPSPHETETARDECS